MTTETIDVPSLNIKAVGELKTKALTFSDLVPKLKITDQHSYEIAANLRGDMKRMLKEVDDKRKGITVHLDNAKKSIMELFRPIETNLDNCIRHTDSLLITYTNEQERIRREQEEKLRKQAEAEERKRKAELEAQAKRHEEKGNLAKAEERRQQAAEVQVIAPTLASTVAKVEGLSFRETWDGEAYDLKQLVKAIAEGRAPIDFIQVNQTAIRKQAIATKDSLIFAGIRFFSTKTPVNR